MNNALFNKIIILRKYDTICKLFLSCYEFYFEQTDKIRQFVFHVDNRISLTESNQQFTKNLKFVSTRWIEARFKIFEEW